MTAELMTVETDVLVIGSGAAGMYAAIEAERRGARVLLADRSLIGRGGATVMAQMTVAVALGEEVPDDPRAHYDDTIAAGRGLCDEKLAQLLCEEAPDCIRELDAWGVGWARKDGHITATMAPGHDRPRCVYVDFINTGPAVSKTLRTHIARNPAIRKAGDLCIVDLAVSDGEVAGAVAWHLGSGAPVVIAAKATILATGGLTRLYRRNSASANMGGDGYALALRAGASLIDMEFVQFFPIGHLAPRLVGMDPIMWDPFRYKLGGRLLNGRREEFTSRYGSDEDGKYVLTRDLATYAIFKEVEAGRGSPHGGAYLSFEHCSAGGIARGVRAGDRSAGGERHRSHPHAGRGRADRALSHGRRQSRRRAWRPKCPASSSPAKWSAAPMAPTGCPAMPSPRLWCSAAAPAGAPPTRGEKSRAAKAAPARHARRARSSARRRARSRRCRNTAAMIARLQAIMADDVGPFRTGAKLRRALAGIAALTAELGDVPIGDRAAFDLRPARMVRPAQYADGGARGRAIRAQPRTKAAARISARIFRNYAAAMAAASAREACATVN